MSGRQSTQELVAEILKQLKALNSKIDKLLQANASHGIESNSPEIDVMTLLSLPASHRQTVMALYKLKKGTASDISTITGRLRAHESALANELCRMRYVQKKREGRVTYFFIEPKVEEKMK